MRKRVVLEKFCEVSQSAGSVEQADVVAEQWWRWVVIATRNMPLSKQKFIRSWRMGDLDSLIPSI